MEKSKKIKRAEFNTGPGIFMITYHILLFITLPIYLYYAFPSFGIWLTAFILLYVTGISITGGYHRFYAHRSYKTNRYVEAVILFFSSMTAQGSALRWAFDHRRHHAFVDTDEDPYSIKKGIWYAHFSWILEKPIPIDPKVVPDLMRNPLVIFQHRWYELCLLTSNLLVFFAVGAAFNDYWGSFFIAIWLRVFALHHFTWFINSLAHVWGDKPFCQEQTAVDNYFLAFLTFGEGYHNYHHTFANDYRNGIRWFHFDPTKWVIWLLKSVGLAYGLKKTDYMAIKKRMLTEHKNLLLEQIKENFSVKREELAKQINELAEQLLTHLALFTQLKDQYREQCQVREYKLIKELKVEMRAIQKKMRQDWREWSKLSRLIRPLSR